MQQRAFAEAGSLFRWSDRGVHLLDALAVPAGR
jgi:hypothetical protein